MKKQAILLSIASSLLAVSCNNKNEGGNKSVIKTEEVKIEEQTFRYIGLDDTSALVTFKDENGEKSIAVESNHKTIAAPLAQDSIYKKDDIEIRAKNDSLYIIQGDNIIELRKAGAK